MNGIFALLAPIKNFEYSTKLLIAIIFTIIMIVLRIFIETYVMSNYFSHYHFLHQFFWYISVILWYQISFKYIIKIDIKKTYPFLYSTIILLIPVTYIHFSNFGKPELVYISIKDGVEIINYFLSLMYTHPTNKPQFYELVLLLTGFVFVSFYYSKSIKRTVMNTIVGFYGSMVVFGLNFFGAHNSSAIVKFTTGLNIKKLFPFIIFTISTLLLFTLLWDEIKDKLQKYFYPRTLVILIVSSGTIFVLNYYVYGTNTIADNFFMLIPIIVIYFTILNFNNISNLSMKFILTLMSIGGFILLIPIRPY